MKARRLVVNVWLAVLLLLTGALAAGSSVSADAISFRGEYYNTTDLTGPLALVRDDPIIDFNWGSGSPAPSVSADVFSVRWTAWTWFAAGDYTFYVTTDDGARLWVDGALIIDQWQDQSETTFAGSKPLAAGYHNIWLEYYENGGQARIKLWWQVGAPPITEWRGEYYTNASLAGAPFLVRNDPAINFDWGYGAPHGGMPTDSFSARWTRDVYLGAGTHTFSATSDDGVRLWVDGVPVIDKWVAQSRTTHTGSITVGAGTHQIKVEYFELGGVASCVVSWGAGGTVPGIEVIVDNLDPAFIWGGSAGSWYARAWGYKNHLNWTWNSNITAYNWAKWNANLPTAGNWKVYVYVASKWFGTKSAKYQVHHAGVRHDVTVNQNNYSNQWVSLGTYAFNGGPGEYVYLSDATGEAYATRFVGFDAVKFVNVDVTPAPVPPPTSPCAITPILGFGAVWNFYPSVQARLGCPTEVEKGVWSAEEVFQTGYMFWRADNTQIYVLKNTGTWQAYPDTWTAAEPEWDPAIVPPAGYYQPKRGFGKIWREQPGVRTGLGWATTEERGFTGSVQAFSGGLMFWSNLRGTYVLYNDGTWQKY